MSDFSTIESILKQGGITEAEFARILPEMNEVDKQKIMLKEIRNKSDKSTRTL